MSAKKQMEDVKTYTEKWCMQIAISLKCYKLKSGEYRHILHKLMDTDSTTLPHLKNPVIPFFRLQKSSSYCWLKEFSPKIKLTFVFASIESANLSAIQLAWMYTNQLTIAPTWLGITATKRRATFDARFIGRRILWRWKRLGQVTCGANLNGGTFSGPARLEVILHSFGLCKAILCRIPFELGWVPFVL